MGGDEISKSGLPDMDAAAKNKGESVGRKMVAGMSVVSALIGLGIGYAIFTFGDTKAYTKKIALVMQYDMQYAYLAAFIFSRMLSFVNVYPMIWKGRVMTGKSGNLRANMSIFREYNSDKIVVLDDGPDTGRYNRANRSLTHLTENMGGLLIGMLLACFCFPFPTLVLISVFSLGRVMHQVGYSNYGYGAHAPGFMLAMLSGNALDGLLLMVALKGFGVPI
mmetsp:Transcript_3454/g.7180  ORF Transcript_3454/g.7180 Transcript_3454/m.7180 type:complete len:221 (-) Transcript_3454:296-958(-)|eukprot:CAMPEP_0118933950 /NCGR_PEP_ID=MMETSP1169-20130426/13084_1 /TAXON_ID=36882 /ORGANISM="Pyramimonas obovata, Strain CCMP722" /LENGTH=220 /DNA_ID=CAMNT_0006876791 /DNA_START=83 /DNA_END=745 /DNA_ORIENTATION=+